ncbi:MAG: 16S rRNA (adenine(1518)-N(6)/adenine(1519)-N(6))-dimethyltransferase RsmA [Desulfosalsimonadaceae bacterium]
MGTAYTPPWKLLNAGHLRPKKALGQNFLVDPSTAEMIIRKSGLTGANVVLEIGAGLGALTLPLAKKAEFVHAVEKDAAVAAVLERQLRAEAVENVRLCTQDVFSVDPGRLCRSSAKRLMVFGNLPYYISSQLLFYLISYRGYIKQADLMFQKEVARRLKAVPGGKSYGRLSVMMQYYAEIRRTAAVGAHLFWPVPQVDAEVLQFRFKFQPAPGLSDPDLFAAVVKAAFGKRRKTLHNALGSSELGLLPGELDCVFAQSGIDPRCRAETLSVEQFARLANTVFACRDKRGGRT